MITTFNDETSDALRRIAEGGSDMTKPLEMDFFVAVPSKAVGNKVALIAQKFGFKVSVEQDGETQEWTCYCTKVLIPEYSAVVQLETQLNSIAKEFGGYADGFGSYGNTEDT